MERASPNWMFSVMFPGKEKVNYPNINHSPGQIADHLAPLGISIILWTQKEAVKLLP